MIEHFALTLPFSAALRVTTASAHQHRKLSRIDKNFFWGKIAMKARNFTELVFVGWRIN